jgi:small basic protein (TIGR04137 family)
VASILRDARHGEQSAGYAVELPAGGLYIDGFHPWKATGRGQFAANTLLESPAMTIDKSLKVKLGSIRSRNVLTRGERIAKLKEADRWKEGDSVSGLPKVRVYKLSLRKKKKAKAPEEAAAGKDKKTAKK